MQSKKHKNKNALKAFFYTRSAERFYRTVLSHGFVGRYFGAISLIKGRKVFLALYKISQSAKAYAL